MTLAIKLDNATRLRMVNGALFISSNATKTEVDARWPRGGIPGASLGVFSLSTATAQNT